MTIYPSPLFQCKRTWPGSLGHLEFPLYLVWTLTWEHECCCVQEEGTSRAQTVAADQLQYFLQVPQQTVLASESVYWTMICWWGGGEWVSENICTIRLYSAIHVGSHWKIQDRRQIENTDNTQTKHNPEQANDAKLCKTKSPWFSHLLLHSARKRGGLVVQCSRAHMGRTDGGL